ncbi:TrkA family potassium uptake protein [bacterium]|nr:TrkA family potassium uptake protein [bacterium]
MAHKCYYIIIVGCGRVGFHLANRFSRDGHSVVVIDKNAITFNDLSSEFSGFKIEGDTTQMAILQQAKIEKADILIATTHEDNVNLMVAQIAKKIFNVRHVIARVFDPKREEIYTQLGIETICPTSIAVERFVLAVKNAEVI